MIKSNQWSDQLNSKLPWKVLTDGKRQLHVGHLMNLLSQMSILLLLPQICEQWSQSAPKPLKFSTHCLKSSWNVWWFTIKCYVVNDGMSGPDWQASINIFAEEARLEAVASSDVPSKVILSIKASVNRPTEQDFSIWNALLSREMTRPPKSCRFPSNVAKWDARGIHPLCWPLSEFQSKGSVLYQGDLVRANTPPNKTIWASLRGFLLRDRN